MIRGVDDGPDGLREDVFDRAMGAKPKRVRNPKPSPCAGLVTDLKNALRRFEDACCKQYGMEVATSSLHMTDDGQRLLAYTFIGRLIDADDYVAPLFDGIREACRG